MKQMDKQTNKMILYCIILVIALIGCTNIESNQGGEVVKDETRNFFKALTLNVPAIASTQLIPTGKTRASNAKDSINTSNYVTLHADFPEDATEIQKKLLKYVRTVQDVSDFHRITAADFSIVPNMQSGENDIIVSTVEIKNVLNPMLGVSRGYLLEQDITEEELNQIIAETGASDEDVILVAMILGNQDIQRAELQVSKNERQTFNFLATPCYAKDNFAKQSNLKVIFDCALEAIGADIFTNVVAFANAKWSKVVIKKIFKIVAKRALGPVGVGIAVAEFGWCIYRHGNTDCSIYASPEMVKQLENNTIEEKLRELEKQQEVKKRKQ